MRKRQIPPDLQNALGASPWLGYPIGAKSQFGFLKTVFTEGPD
jgi:hypothetical protein